MRVVAEVLSIEERAQSSLGISDTAIYKAILRVMQKAGVQGGTLLDVGCGEGHLRRFALEVVDRYIGTDIVRYQGFPPEAEFLSTNLESGCVPFADDSMDVVAAVEVIEHLENPRAFVRELARCVRPGGVVVVSTPNQLSALSLMTLAMKQRHAAFQDVHYPAHLTALLPVDLVRIAREAGLEKVQIRYTNSGRIVFTPWHYPTSLARLCSRLMSDNVVLLARRPRYS